MYFAILINLMHQNNLDGLKEAYLNYLMLKKYIKCTSNTHYTNFLDGYFHALMSVKD